MNIRHILGDLIGAVSIFGILYVGLVLAAAGGAS